MGAILVSQIRTSFAPAIAKLGLTNEQIQTIAGSAQHGELTTNGLSPTAAAAVKSAFDSAFMQGFRPALLFAGGVLLVAAVVSNRFIPGRETIAEHHATADAAEAVPAH